MTMTIMKSDLTRWLKLYIREPELRPLGLTYDGEFWWLARPHKDGYDYLGTSDPDTVIQEEHAELLIIAKAIRWFNSKHEGLTIGDGSWDEEFEGAWPGGFSVKVFSPMIDEIRSDDRLVDALYKAVIAVWDNDTQMDKEYRKRNSWWRKAKKKLGEIFSSDPNDVWG